MFGNAYVPVLRERGSGCITIDDRDKCGVQGPCGRDSITCRSVHFPSASTMPPRPTPTAEEIDALAAKFETIGLNQAKAKDAAKSPKIAEPLKHLVETFKLSERSVNDKQASLFVYFASPGSKLSSDQERGYIVDKIIDGKLKSTDQVNGESDILAAWHPPLF